MNKKLKKSEIKIKGNDMLKMVGLDEYSKQSINKLSGGQQQRVTLARALVMNPKVLLLDEPLSNLDAKLRLKMRKEIKDIQTKFGITTVFVTHDQEEALSISDRVVVMNRGRIEQIGTPKEIYVNPYNKFVSEFIGRINYVKAENN